MANLADYKIKIFTRSMNYELYCYSQHFITLPFDRVRLTQTTADGYLYQIIEDVDCDIAINIDEDAFVLDEQAILDLVEYVIDNEYANAGMADGGEVVIRTLNPIVTNPFFNVFNLKLIRKKFNLNAILHFDYSQHKEQMNSCLPKYLSNNATGLEVVDFEPYYPFFFWLAYNFKTLYLPATTYDDGITTILMNHHHAPMMYHTWYSRHFKHRIDLGHTIRILEVIHLVSEKRNIPMHISLVEGIQICLTKFRKIVCNNIKMIIK